MKDPNYSQYSYCLKMIDKDPPSHQSLLIYDPRIEDARTMENHFSEQGYNVKITDSIKDAKDILRKRPYSHLLSHIKDKDCDGMKLLQWTCDTILGIKKYGVIGTRNHALHSMIYKLGANDCFFFEAITLDVLTEVLADILDGSEGIGWCRRRSPAFQECGRRIHAEANLSGCLLIKGDSGVGKSSIARLIHADGERRNHPFIVADCSQYISTDDALAMLRGRETEIKHPLYRNQQGLLAQANGGTLFIRNIHHLYMPLQEVLADVIQRGVFIPQSHSKEIGFNGRIITSTSENLENLVSEGLFSLKLFHLITSSILQVPTLAECQDDIIPLAEAFIRYCCTERDMEIPRLTKGAMNKLCNHIWTGNVRELYSTISRTCAEFRGDTIGKDDIVLSEIRAPEKYRHSRNYNIKNALRHTKGNKAQAAKLLGITRATLYIWMNEEGIPKDYR